MLKLSKSLGLTLAALLFSVSTFAAYDFSAADKLFAARDNNPGNILAARGLYEQALRQTRGSELQYAVERLSRLAYYEGDLLTSESESEKRKGIFQKCLDNVEYLNPSKFGQNPVYYYWKSACLALWAKSAGQWAALGRVGELKKTLQEGLAQGEAHEGGGIHRVAAGVYIKSKALALLGLYDPQKALEHANKAIQLGPQYFNAYLVKAEVLHTLGRTDEALEVLEDAKTKLEQKLASSSDDDLKPENKVYLIRVKQMLRDL